MTVRKIRASKPQQLKKTNTDRLRANKTQKLSTEALVDVCLNLPLTSELVINGQKAPIKLNGHSEVYRELMQREDAALAILDKINLRSKEQVRNYDAENFKNALHFFRNLMNGPLLLAQDPILHKLDKKDKIRLMANCITILKEMTRQKDKFGLTTLSYVAYMMGKIMTNVDSKLFNSKLKEFNGVAQYLRSSALPGAHTLDELSDLANDFVKQADAD